VTTQRSSAVTVGVNAQAPGTPGIEAPTDTYLSVQRLEDLYFAIPLAEILKKGLKTSAIYRGWIAGLFVITSASHGRSLHPKSQNGCTVVLTGSIQLGKIKGVCEGVTWDERSIIAGDRVVNSDEDLNC
jgi:hypothetical protein